MNNSPLTAYWLGVTLHSIGDAVIATDAGARVTFMNPVAEALTGWTAAEATGTPLATVFDIVNMDTRLQVESPVTKALREGIVVGLANHTLLIARDGTEQPIDDSAAPIRDEAGEVAGVVFRDITERHQHEQDLNEVARHVRRNLAHEGVQLVAVTGYGQDSDRARSTEAGSDVYLVKQVESSALRDLLAGVHPAAS